MHCYCVPPVCPQAGAPVHGNTQAIQPPEGFNCLQLCYSYTEHLPHTLGEYTNTHAIKYQVKSIHSYLTFTVNKVQHIHLPVSVML